MRIVSFSVTAIILAGIIVLETGILGWTCLFSFMLGLMILPILPSSYGFAGKVTGTVPPAVVNGLMMSGAQLYSFFASLITSALLGHSRFAGYGFIAVTVCIGSLCTVFVKDEESLKRLESGSDSIDD